MLYIFTGLPGAGKTTLARELARQSRAVHLRIDTIEQALRDCGNAADGPEGYIVAYRIAADNLRLGISVVADSVNSPRVTREAWRLVAADSKVAYVEIEVICSDPAEHRLRIESRSSDIAGHRLPTWDELKAREYERWDSQPIVIDTAGQTVLQSVAAMKDALAKAVRTTRS